MTEYTLPMPSIDDSTYQFGMSVSLANETLIISLRWLDNLWRAFVEFSDGTIREAGVFANCVNWTGFNDYTIEFVSDKDLSVRSNIQYATIAIVEKD